MLRPEALAVVHPLPSTINALLVGALAVVAGGGAWRAASLAVAMLGLQAAIGAVNDVVDAEADRLVKPHKPIPARLISRRAAVGVAGIGAGLGLAISASLGPMVLVLGALGLGCGLAYDLFMRRVGLGWLCFAAALPLMLLWAWEAASGELPPGWPFLLPLAAIAGPSLHLANGLADLELDRAAGRRSLALELGPRRGRRLLAFSMATILALAWATLAASAAITEVIAVAATVTSAVVSAGVALSWRPGGRARELGWTLQAAGLALMAVVWLAAVTQLPI